MELNRTFAAGCLTVVLVICCICSCTAVINGQDNDAIVSAVNKGANILEAQCAIRNDNDNMCSILAAKH